LHSFFFIFGFLNGMTFFFNKKISVLKIKKWRSRIFFLNKKNGRRI